MASDDPRDGWNADASGGNRGDSLKSLASLVYLLQALSFLLGVTSIIGVIINYLRLGDARGTWVESHFVWQIRTFWFQLLWSLVGWATIWILIGWVIWGVVYFWTLYRVVKGWLNLVDDRPMYAESD